MIEKMSFINITGPIKKLDEFVVKMILPYEVELVNAFTIVDKIEGIHKFSDFNPYKEPINNMGRIRDMLGITLNINEGFNDDKGELDEIAKDIEETYEDLKAKKDRLSVINKEIEIKENLKNQIIPIKNLQVDIQEFFDFDYLKFRFGYMPIDQFEKIAVYEKEMELIVYETSRTNEVVYLMYFMPRSMRNEIDKLFVNMHFTRIRISDDIVGHPADAYEQIDGEIKVLEEEKAAINEYFNEFIKENHEHLDDMYTYLTKLNNVFNVRDLAIKTQEAFYLTGWIETNQLEAFKRDIEKIESVALILDDAELNDLKPPTKLSNPKFFRPFEALVNMYGVPSYGELDPTIFVAICYVLFFGIMFGDVGQGLVIVLLSLYLYKKKKNPIIMIGAYIGTASIVFGFIYGSVFGDEELLPRIFGYQPVRPMESMMDILVTTTVFGIVLLVVAMILNMVNLFRQGRFGRLLTDKNGLAGLIFYLSVLGSAYLIYKEHDVSIPVVIILVLAPLIVIIFSAPLTKLIEKNRRREKNAEHGSAIELVFEIIEMLLAFLSNTLSFLRVGAFALNHVGFFLAFHMLSEIVAKSGGEVGKILVMIFGNILIIVLEGMIVAIQAMRLTYYELFSRFYSGDGKQFKPYKIEKEN